MIINNVVQVIDSHTMGEPTRVIVSGIPALAGNSVAEKRDYFAKNFDHIRTGVLLEPRGHSGMFVSMLTEPVHKDAHIGLIFMDASSYPDMCIHATVGTVTVLIESGMITRKKPVTDVLIETAAGLVRAQADFDGNTVQSVTIENVPSSLLLKSANINIEGRDYLVDVVYSGNMFALVDAQQFGIKVVKDNVHKLIDIGLKVRDICNEQLTVQHLGKNKVEQVSIYGEPIHSEADAKNIVVSGKGKVDRSPCGTGTCARMTSLFFNNQLDINQVFINEGILGTTFKGKVIKQLENSEIPAIIPQVTASAYIIGMSSLFFSGLDPFRGGFYLI